MGRGPTERLVDRLFDRCGAKLHASCAERILVEVHQMLRHNASIYGRHTVYHGSAIERRSAIIWVMATQGPTKTADTEKVAASLLKLARSESGLSQRTLAKSAAVPHSTVARIESGAMQPTLPLLYRILAAADLEPRIRLEAYDDHDDVLDALAEKFPENQQQMENARDAALSALNRSRPRAS